MSSKVIKKYPSYYCGNDIKNYLFPVPCFMAATILPIIEILKYSYSCCGDMIHPTNHTHSCIISPWRLTVEGLSGEVGTLCADLTGLTKKLEVSPKDIQDHFSGAWEAKGVKGWVRVKSYAFHWRWMSLPPYSGKAIHFFFLPPYPNSAWNGTMMRSRRKRGMRTEPQ